MIKKITAVVLATVMVAAICVTTAFAAYDKTKLDYGTASGQYEVMSGVKYSEYAVQSGSGVDYRTQVSILEFDPDEYLPVVYNGYSGSLTKLATTYSYATQKDGYEVAGIVNGSFFSMSNGWLVEYFVSDGKVSCADNNNPAEVIAFMSDGKINVVNSTLSFGLYLDGKPVSEGLYAINKHYGQNETWADKFYYFDSDCGRVADTYSTHPGYEIVCEKLNNTDLTVGGTLKGKVVEVKKNSYGTQVSTDAATESNTFVLFCLADSKYKTYAENLKAGSYVEISVDETIESSKEIIRNAQSVIANVGWLVKDGVDMTEKQTTIGSHNVETTYAQWTAIGTKPDGTYVFFTSDAGSRSSGESLLLKDVAKMMIDLGCNNVWRMDGGGSVSMYVSNTGDGSEGFKMVTETATGRSVADTIMIVKRSSMRKQTYIDALQAAVDDAEKVITSSSPDDIKEALTAAKAVLSSKDSINSDLLKALMNLQKATGGTAELDELIAQCSTVSTGDYSEYALEQLWDSYENALKVRANANSTADEYTAAANSLRAALVLKGDIEVNVAADATITLSKPRSDSYKSSLIDGISSGDLYGAGTVWYGFGTGGYAQFDFGTKQSDFSKLSLCLMPGNAGDGIVCPSYIALTVSDDGENWTEIERNEFKEDKYKQGSTTATYWIDFDLSKVNARYIKLLIEGKWTFISEIEIYRAHKTLEDYIYVNNFNTSITTGATTIFTQSFSGYSDGKLDVASANLDWTRAVSFKPVGDGVYEAVATNLNPRNLKSVELPEGGFVLAAHKDDSGSDMDFRKKTEENHTALSAIKVGDRIVVKGIDVKNETVLPGGYVTVQSAVSLDQYGVVNGDKFEMDLSLVADGKTASAADIIAACDGNATVKDKNGKTVTGNSAVGTGATITSGSTTLTVIIKGDVNGDGKVDIVDATVVKHVLQKSEKLDGVYKEAALLGDSQNVKMLDYTKIRRFIQFGTQY